jgi:fermentation-respiration switch protein FrsA (DUF1100 family)
LTQNVFDSRAKIATAARLSELGILLFHGTADDFVQPSNSERLDAAIGSAGPHALVRVEGADHGTVPTYPVYDARLRAFLNR